MSPERFKGEVYTSDTDLWSLGLTIIECAWGKYPYPEEKDKHKNFGFWELLDCISTKPSPKLPPDFSDEMNDFVSIW
jgi:mitogen-activated protein kinase kinase 1